MTMKTFSALGLKPQALKKEKEKEKEKEKKDKKKKDSSDKKISTHKHKSILLKKARRKRGQKEAFHPYLKKGEQAREDC